MSKTYVGAIGMGGGHTLVLDGNGNGNAKQAGAWVKTPGLQPEEGGALNYLTLGHLAKLKERVEKAIEHAKAKAVKASSFLPGVRVRLVRQYYGLAKGREGLVINRGFMDLNDDEVGVVIENVGYVSLPATAVEHV